MSIGTAYHYTLALYNFAIKRIRGVTYNIKGFNNSSSCTTTELSKLLTSSLTAVKTCYQVL